MSELDIMLFDELTLRYLLISPSGKTRIVDKKEIESNLVELK